MTKMTVLLRLAIVAGLCALLLGCLKKPVEEAEVDVSGDTVSFPAYTIIEGDLEAPAQGPYIAFAGSYPEHWPDTWQLSDEFFITAGGAFTEKMTELQGLPVAAWEFEGVFHGSVDELTEWFIELASTVGVEALSTDLDPIFEVIERRKVELDPHAWGSHGLTGSIQFSYGPRYGEYTHFVFSVAQRIEEDAEQAEPVTE